MQRSSERSALTNLLDASAVEHVGLSPATKRLRAYIAWEKKSWGTRTFLSCIAYLSFVALTVVAESPLIERTDKSTAAFVWTYYGILWFWMLIHLLNGVYFCISGAFFYKFSGRAVVFETIFYILAISPEWLYKLTPFMDFVLHGSIPGKPPGLLLWQSYIGIISMAFMIYVEKSFGAPVVNELHLYFNGVTTDGELKQSKKGEGPTIVTGIRLVANFERTNV